MSKVGNRQTNINRNIKTHVQRLQKLIYLYLFTDCFMKISLQSSEQFLDLAHTTCDYKNNARSATPSALLIDWNYQPIKSISNSYPTVVQCDTVSSECTLFTLSPKTWLERGVNECHKL